MRLLRRLLLPPRPVLLLGSAAAHHLGVRVLLLLSLWQRMPHERAIEEVVFKTEARVHWRRASFKWVAEYARYVSSEEAPALGGTPEV